MSKYHASPRERRFIGNVKTWRIVCSECGHEEVVGTNKSRPMPPNIVIKKLTRSGWRIDGNPKRDLCADCVRKPIQGRLALATKALQDVVLPMLHDGRTHFSEVLDSARTLDPEQAKQLMNVLKERIPAKPKREPRKENEPQSDDVNYEQWLDEQE